MQDIKILKDINKTRDIIRRKYKLLRSGMVEKESNIKDTFKPITEGLKDITDEIKKKKYVETVLPSPSIKKEKIEQIKSNISNKNLSNDTEEAETADAEAEEEENNKLQNLIKMLLGNEKSKRELDKSYGVRLINNSFKIGNKNFTILDRNQIQIGEKSYKTTPGLLELIFLNAPDRKIYTKEDLNNYKTILLDTLVYKRGYNADGQIQGNRYYKYTSIVKDLVKNKQGHGIFMNLSDKPFQYIYWDEPNELVNRLRLLYASQQAGNNNHNNEITSILEELREANIIK